MPLLDDDFNPYEVLGISPDADDDELRAAYRREARRWHPDVNPAPEAGERMRLAGLAYQLLTNPEARAAYDSRPLLPVFIPDILDFGDVRQGAGGVSQTVRLRRTRTGAHGEIELDLDRASGTFWELDPSVRDGDDPSVLLELRVWLSLPDDLAPGLHEEELVATVNGEQARLRLQANVRLRAPLPPASPTPTPPEREPSGSTSTRPRTPPSRPRPSRPSSTTTAPSVPSWTTTPTRRTSSTKTVLASVAVGAVVLIWLIANTGGGRRPTTASANDASAIGQQVETTTTLPIETTTTLPSLPKFMSFTPAGAPSGVVARQLDTAAFPRISLTFDRVPDTGNNYGPCLMTHTSAGFVVQRDVGTKAIGPNGPIEGGGGMHYDGPTEYDFAMFSPGDISLVASCDGHGQPTGSITPIGRVVGQAPFSQNRMTAFEGTDPKYSSEYVGVYQTHPGAADGDVYIFKAAYYDGSPYELCLPSFGPSKDWTDSSSLQYSDYRQIKSLDTDGYTDTAGGLAFEVDHYQITPGAFPADLCSSGSYIVNLPTMP